MTSLQAFLSSFCVLFLSSCHSVRAPTGFVSDVEPETSAIAPKGKPPLGVVLGIHGGLPLDRRVDVEFDDVPGGFGDEFDLDGDYIVGVRFGYLPKASSPGSGALRIDLGAVFDVSVLEQSASEFSEEGLTTIVFSPQILLAAKLGSVDGSLRDRGLVEPFLALGPALFHVDSETLDDDDYALGLSGSLGLAVPLNDTVSIFTEGRLTYAEPEFSDPLVGRITVDLLTFSILGGLQFRF